MHRLLRAAVAGTVLTLAATGLVACSGDDTSPSPPSGSFTEPSAPNESSNVIAIAEVIDDLEYYYACGNEVLSLADGRVFYPLHLDEQDSFDDSEYESPLADAPAEYWAASVYSVVPPSPGDDTGTLTIYEDGTAHWVSDNGRAAWMSDQRQEYNWDC